MRQLDLYSETKEHITSCPSFPGFTSSFKTAMEHNGYAVVSSERKVYIDGHRDYVWDIVVYHNGKEIFSQKDISGMEIRETIDNVINTI